MTASVVSLAERLRARRAELGLSQAQAARELDVARTAYRLWELEASRPAPDRWRLIASWLGVSVTTMLVANDMVSDTEASVSNAVGAGQFSSAHAPDYAAEATNADFYADAGRLLNEAAASGAISVGQAQQFAALLRRLESGSSLDEGSHTWEPAELRQYLPATDEAPRQAREAIAFLGSALASTTVENAQLLTSELVTNSVRHAGMAPDDTIGLFVKVTRSLLYVAVSDTAPMQEPVLVAPSANGGRGLHIVSALASRWGGATSEDGRKTTWFELNLQVPEG